MSDPLLIGVDVGTTSIKAIAFDRRGQIHTQAAAPTPTHHPRPGWAYHEPDALWQTVVSLLRDLVDRLETPRAVTGLAVTSVGEAGVPLDASGDPTYDSIAWFDTRSAPQAMTARAK